MKLTTENLVKVLDQLVTTPHWRKAMGVIRASEPLAFVWRSQSIKAAKDNDTSSIFFLEWRGVFDFWHAHAGRARMENVILHEAAIRDQSLNGIEEPIYGPDQKPIWKDDSRFIGRDDDYVREVLGMADFEDVTPWHRLEHDAQGNPVQLTKHTQIPAPLRLRVLEQDRRYIERKEHDVKIEGEITVAKPLQRLPGEARPDVAKLRALAALPPEKRREQIGASKHPLDANGHRTMPPTGLPSARDDNLPVIEKPSPYAAYQPPEPKLNPSDAPRPSYARPEQRLDVGEQTGRGTPPPGGFPVKA